MKNYFMLAHHIHFLKFETDIGSHKEEQWYEVFYIIVKFAGNIMMVHSKCL